VANSEDDLAEAFEGAAREGEKFFSDPTVYLERYLEDPRHVEVQVLADSHGNVVHLGERDCSIQRRHQKLIEEAPAPHVDDAMRERIGGIATEAAAAVGYRSAGTVEGLQEGEDYFFLEMNTRVQVEHCVTEMATGIDIVREQVQIAAGEKLSVAQDDVELRGHAIECRINAEAAHKGFAPAPGRIDTYTEPAGPGVRVDSGVRAGSEVTPLYDPMIAKLIVWDSDRERATARMLRALDEYEIGGLTTLIPFHRAILATEQWRRAETCRDLLGDKKWLKSLAPTEPSAAAPDGAAEEQPPLQVRDYRVEVDGRLHEVKVIGAAPAEANPGPAAGLRRPPRRERAGGGAAGGGAGETLVSPIQGSVLKVAVSQGDEVDEGTLICIVEAMKMENEITAHRAGKVAELGVAEGGSVAAGDMIARIVA
jgi:acetyl-CoA/propionyl-CoA carboxylase biotin carboxyl carrier protein